MRLLTRILTFLFVLGVLGGVFTPASAESFKGISTLVLSSEETALAPGVSWDATQIMGYAVAFLLGAAVASGVFVVVLLIKKKAEQ